MIARERERRLRLSTNLMHFINLTPYISRLIITNSDVYVNRLLRERLSFEPCEPDLTCSGLSNIKNFGLNLGHVPTYFLFGVEALYTLPSRASDPIRVYPKNCVRKCSQ